MTYYRAISSLIRKISLIQKLANWTFLHVTQQSAAWQLIKAFFKCLKLYNQRSVSFVWQIFKFLRFLSTAYFSKLFICITTETRNFTILMLIFVQFQSGSKIFKRIEPFSLWFLWLHWIDMRQKKHFLLWNIGYRTAFLHCQFIIIKYNDRCHMIDKIT